MYYTDDSQIFDVTYAPVFGDYGRLIFPVDDWYYSGETLAQLNLTWYSHVDPDKTVEICNYVKSNAEAGNTIFYDMYTEEEKTEDPAKRDTGFFFKGDPGVRFAICNAGGGFVYVGAMHDSVPHALELSKQGYNVFALIYSPCAQTSCEDLAQAISFIFEHAEELEVDTDCYSLWGGSAEREWQPTIEPMAQQHLGAMICPSWERWLCSTQDTTSTANSIRPLMSASEQVMALTDGAPWRHGSTTWQIP